MFSLTNNSSKNNTFSFDGGNLTIYGGLVLFKGTSKNILSLVVRKSPTGESTHYFFFMLK